MLRAGVVELLDLATSLFPDRRNENQFFVEGPRKILSHRKPWNPPAWE